MKYVLYINIIFIEMKYVLYINILFIDTQYVLYINIIFIEMKYVLYINIIFIEMKYVLYINIMFWPYTKVWFGVIDIMQVLDILVVKKGGLEGYSWNEKGLAWQWI